MRASRYRCRMRSLLRAILLLSLTVPMSGCIVAPVAALLGAMGLIETATQDRTPVEIALRQPTPNAAYEGLIPLEVDLGNALDDSIDVEVRAGGAVLYQGPIASGELVELVPDTAGTYDVSLSFLGANASGDTETALDLDVPGVVFTSRWDMTEATVCDRPETCASLSEDAAVVVQGTVTVQGVLLDPAGNTSRLDRAEFHLDGELVATASDTEPVTVDVTELADGPRTVAVTYLRDDGASVSRAGTLDVRNCGRAADLAASPLLLGHGDALYAAGGRNVYEARDGALASLATLPESVWELRAGPTASTLLASTRDGGIHEIDVTGDPAQVTLVATTPWGDPEHLAALDGHVFFAPPVPLPQGSPVWRVDGDSFVTIFDDEPVGALLAHDGALWLAEVGSLSLDLTLHRLTLDDAGDVATDEIVLEEPRFGVVDLLAAADDSLWLLGGPPEAPGVYRVDPAAPAAPVLVFAVSGVDVDLALFTRERHLSTCEELYVFPRPGVAGDVQTFALP
jgi:hypothetical protein